MVLWVHNLSRFHQPVEFNLQHWAGYTPIEVTGHVSAHRREHVYLAALLVMVYRMLTRCLQRCDCFPRRMVTVATVR